MTSSSSPISLKQEGISYIVGAELPCLIVNIVRAARDWEEFSQPSLIISRSKRRGHGDYHMVVLARQVYRKWLI